MKILHPFFRRNRTTTSAAVAAVAATATTVTKSLAAVAFGGASSALSASSSYCHLCHLRPFNSSLQCSPRREGAAVSSSPALLSWRCTSSSSVRKAKFSDKDEQQYIKSYQLTGIGTGTHVQIDTVTGHRIQTDIPKAMGGQDTAPQPVELLLSSWMGCTQATAMYVYRQIIRMRRQHKKEPIKNRTGRHNINNDNNNNNTTIQLDTIVFENIVAHRDERGALQLPIQDRPRIPSQLFSITGTIRVYFKTTRPASFTTTITPVVSEDGGEDSAPDPHGENKQSSRSTGVSSSSSSALLLTEEEFELFQEQVEVRCPIANMIITSGCRINVDWIQMKSTP